MPPAWLLARRQWPYAQVTLHRKPSVLAPLVIGPALHPRLVVRPAGATRVGITRHGIRRSHQNQPGSVYLSPAHEVYELDWQGRPGEFIDTIQLDLHDCTLP